MTKVCLECATPKFFAKTDTLGYCSVCERNTHTIEGTARRPLCHDCSNYQIKCQDGAYRPALDYGSIYLSKASCRAGEGSLIDTAIEKIAPTVVQYEHVCSGFKKHHAAPNDGRPNPLTRNQREEWRKFLEMPSAFWLEPKRWDRVIDTHKEMFWDKQPKSKGGVTKTLLGLGVIAAGLLVRNKLVDNKADPATPEQTSGD